MLAVPVNQHTPKGPRPGFVCVVFQEIDHPGKRRWEQTQEVIPEQQEGSAQGSGSVPVEEAVGSNQQSGTAVEASPAVESGEMEVHAEPSVA